MLKSIFFFLFTHFAVGLLLTIVFISLAQIGKLFFRVTTWVAFVLVFLALLAQPFGSIRPESLLHLPTSDLTVTHWLTYWAFILVEFSLVLYNVFHPKLHRFVLAVTGLLGLTGVVAYSLSVVPLVGSPGAGKLLLVASGVGSCLVLGSVLAAMTTGHWYLVKHGLSLSPLKNSTLIYLGSVVFRTLLMGLIFLLPAISYRRPPALLATQLDVYGYIFWGRVAFGLVVPLIFGFMVWSAAKIRSTQSATGILYATIVLVLLGETFARVLFLITGIPV